MNVPPWQKKQYSCENEKYSYEPKHAPYVAFFGGTKDIAYSHNPFFLLRSILKASNERNLMQV